MKDIRGTEFSNNLRERIRAKGYFQKNLADELGLHPKVFSRKLRGNGNAHLTGQEVRRIITTLAQWKVITTRDEALHLLELAQVEPSSISAQEWQAPPLDLLEGSDVTPQSRNGYIPARTFQHNLPAPLTRLVGRDHAVEQLRQLLEQDAVRLVTLVGPGGSGKTRLALHVAGELVGSFAQGVWFVALATLRNADLVPQSIMQTLNIKPAPSLPAVQSLINYLRDKQLLVLLDNFEQVGEAAAVLGDLLAAAPGLKVLVTSRAVLHLYGENEFNVPPLDVPDSSVVLDMAKLARYSAVQLFVERARAVAPDFALTAENAASIAQICARVDGLPLALELAAARVKVLPPALLLERLLQARLPVLTGRARNLPDRQQTLRNTITWSYNLLSPTALITLVRLGVFSGGWSLEAAEAMMLAFTTSMDEKGLSLPASTLDLLEHLVDNSLLVRLPVAAGRACFTLLETLREYALEQLNADGELERLRDWHACYYLAMAEASEIGLRGPQQLIWQELLVAERDNYRAALEWSLQRARDRAGTMISIPVRLACRSTRGTARNEIELLETSPGTELLAIEVFLRLSAALRPYWEWQGYLVEGRSWLEAALAMPLEEKDGRTIHAARAKALNAAARLACLQNEQSRAIALAEESITLWQRLDEPRGLAAALLYRGWAAIALGDYELAKRMFEQGLQLLSPADDAWLRGQMLFYLGTVAGFSKDFEQMRSFYARSRELFEQVGDKSALADVLKDQGGMAILEGNYVEAIANLLKSIALSLELGYKQFVATGMGLLGFAVGMQEEPDPASATLQTAQLWGATDGLLDAIGSSSWLGNLPAAQEMILQIRTRVDKQVGRQPGTRAGHSLKNRLLLLIC